MNPRPLISVVDDDESLRESLPDLIREFDCDVHTFASAEDFQASAIKLRTSCLILDVAMPNMTGPELQQELAHRNLQIPIIFITAHRDEALRLRLMKEGAVDCLFKPFSDNALQEAIDSALCST